MEYTTRTKPNELILLAEEQVQFIIDERHISVPGRVFQRLWPSPWVIVEVSGVTRDPKPSPPGSPTENFLSFPHSSEGPHSVQFENGGCVEVVPSSWLYGQQDAELHLKYSPSVAFSSGEPIVSLEFSILNITGDLFHWPLTLHAPPWLTTIEPVPGIRDIETALRADGGYAVTHKGWVQQSDGKGFSEDDAQLFLRGLGHFLSFACGSRCAIANVVGFNTRGDEAWKRWGSHSVSSWKSRRTWADITIREALPKIFGEFWLNYSSTSKHLDRVLGWYVSSNEAEALDLSVVLNQIVLELLISLMPSARDETGAIGIRIASMLQEQGIDPQIPLPCSALRALANEHGFVHGPHTLVEIRNSIVHSNSNLELVSNNTYREAQNLGLWYIELLLLRMFKYSGEFASRLADVQRAGATELVPWAKEAIT